MAHGSPCAPLGPERALRELARAVAARLPEGWTVRGTTLAMKDGLHRAVRTLGARAPLLVYPLFMADGWFVNSELPRRLAQVGADRCTALAPLGLDPRLHRLALWRARAVARRQGNCADIAVLLAAHGSSGDPRPARAARQAAGALAASGAFREVRVGFVEEPPFLADAARGMGASICLPFFAMRAGHVERDVPTALADAGFTGSLLPPLGADPSIPGLIADALVSNR